MKKILIIEDDLDIQELIQFFLEDQGYEVITASDGIDGIAVFLKEQIDLILLDILLPKMDGYAVCELIRKESEVGNAIKYTNEDGNIWVGVYKRGEEIIFWIENETESIDEKEIPKLCDAFYRIDKSRNKRTGGSGLGLYITKMILEQHQFPYCIENTEKGIKVEIRCYEPTRRLL